MSQGIVSQRSSKPAGRLVRPAGFAILLMGVSLATAPIYSAHGASTAAESYAGQQSAGPGWLANGDERAALALISLLQTAELDGLDPDRFKVKSLKKAVRAASGSSPTAVARAETMLDRALVNYAAALRGHSNPDWTINDRAAVPSAPSAAALMAQAGAAPSLEAWVNAMPFMHPGYASLRRAFAEADERGDPAAANLLRINLQRIRFLPAEGRYVLVNIAAQQLYMYEGGKIVDTMRVVVGKPKNPTPMMAATIKFAALNPYWQVPPDLAAERIAPNVVKDGLGYLKQHGYVLLSDWGENAQPIDPATVDWAAVESGKIQVRVRQSPGPGNAMGRMKFMFPNPQGIYLHDTPDKKLLKEDARLFSGGCVRLEDAPRLAKWMFGNPLNPKGAGTEQKVDLPTPVPVYLAYLTAMPEGSQVVFHQDIYGRDQAALAQQSNDRRKLAVF